ncbi:MAG: 2-amino-4-hydroxy-6-hydroxymethyldihydropteridine diphosphokinase [Lachnospiraceae bacterium]|nr:2-amino-4-hydroxy-6-hydroxymethyldihydropteridine diphosphokinase [Lachnospiraceae bacterium]RKI79471.1 2-amino-4-hydroxy-6-hydroxymethyldihydropteridine diphosphokinase [bacterium 1xD42-87]
MADQIIVEDLQIYAHHGVYRQENEKGQNFYISAVLDTDTRAAGMADDLGLSTNYGVVCRFLHTFLTEHTYKLIETAAEKASEALLLQFPYVRQVTMEVKKPEAPITVPFGSVSVKITRGWHRVYIACGSNIGDRRAHLSAAVDALLMDKRCRVLRVSDWVETTPYGGVEQADYLNGVLSIETLYTPEELLEVLQGIEKAEARERKERWGPRTLDLDILLYEGRLMDTDKLTIPHKDMQNRDFVLKPLSQIAPYERHPVFNKAVVELLAEVERNGEKHVL